MTADERIENLLNEFGQTISDLPKRYEQNNRNSAFDSADKFAGSLSMTQNFEDYICHLVDVIDRLELALERAIWERDNPLQDTEKEEMPKANYNERSESRYVNDWD